MRIRKPGKIEIILQLLLALVMMVFVFDYFQAAQANACGSSLGGNKCYPWGAEGPVADSWRYENKETYLKSELVLIAVIATAIAAPFLAFGMLSGLISSVLVLALGVSALQWLVAQL